jgi:hypothetical protein
MAGRTRTTKKLAQRIDRNYFKNRFAFARWRQYLSYALTAAGLVWLGSQAVANRQKPYSSGPIAVSHAFIGPMQLVPRGEYQFRQNGDGSGLQRLP